GSLAASALPNGHDLAAARGHETCRRLRSAGVAGGANAGMKTLRWSELDPRERAQLLRRPALTASADVQSSVSRIIEQVRAEGDDALRVLTRSFDGVDVAVLE